MSVSELSGLLFLFLLFLKQQHLFFFFFLNSLTTKNSNSYNFGVLCASAVHVLTSSRLILLTLSMSVLLELGKLGVRGVEELATVPQLQWSRTSLSF